MSKTMTFDEAVAAEEQAIEEHSFIALVKPGVYVKGSPGSADRLRAAHKAIRCVKHWPMLCTCDGSRL